MRSDADRVSQDREIIMQPLCEGARERFERPPPIPFMSRCLQMQLKQPRPAIRPLEPAAQRPIEISKLTADLFGRESLAGEPLYRFRFFSVRKQPAQCQQRPPAVDAAVPIEAAEEDGVQ